MDDSSDLARKIARLVEERGWNQEDFARIANLNRHTIREILKHGEGRRLRNATVSQCAKALDLQVNELRDFPLEKLLPRMHGKQLPEDEGGLRVLIERSTSPELKVWLDQSPTRAAQITPSEAEELLRMEGPNGLMVKLGVEACIERLERKRRLLNRVAFVAGTDFIDVLEPIVGLMFDKLNPPKAA